MASEVVVSCSHLLVGAYDFSPQCTEVIVNRSSESVDISTMGSATRKHKGGVKDVQVTSKGLVNLADSGLDGVIFNGIAADNSLVTAFPNGIPWVACSTSGGYGVNAVSIKHVLGGSYGAVLPFDFDAMSQSDAVHAVILHNSLTTAWGTCALTTDSNVGAAIPLSTSGMSTSEKLYGGFHITALSTAIGGGGLGVSAVIAAASSSGFLTSSTRITFSAKTCKSGTWATPIASSALSTDQPYVRAVVTMATGTSSGYTGTGLIWVGHQ